MNCGAVSSRNCAKFVREKVVLWLLNYCSRCHVSRPLPNEKGNFIGHFYRQSQTMEGNSEARTTDAADNGSNTDSSTSTLAYDKLFICSANGLFTLIEIVSAAADLQLSVGNDDGTVIEWSCKICIWLTKYFDTYSTGFFFCRLLKYLDCLIQSIISHQWF